MRQFAFFDLDDTVLRGTSDHVWLEFLLDEGLADARHLEREGARFQDQYRRGELDMADFVRFSTAYLQQQHQTELGALQSAFARKRLAPILCPKAVELMAEERTRGATVVLVTATNDFLAGAASHLLKPDHCLATQLARCEAGRITGEIDDTPCFREGKLHHIARRIGPSRQEWKAASAYSDSINDLPLLAAAGRPHAVNPCRRLRAHALDQQWPILDLNHRAERKLT